MALNTAYLSAGRGPESDECLTPRYGVLPIVKYLIMRQYWNIYCPFDAEHSQYVRVLRSYSFTVHHGMDFFNTPTPPGTQCIVSNPPFSIKDDILERLYELAIPFAVLLPQNSLQGKRRVSQYMKNGLQYLGFDGRINFYTRGDLAKWKPANHMATGYFCRDVLPYQLMFEELEPVQEPYMVIK